MPKTRLDVWLVEKGLVESRQKAYRLILANVVLVNDQPVTKPGFMVPEDGAVRFRSGFDIQKQYVSRGGVKLAFALEHFAIDVHQMTALDIGASTGGFTDVLLQKGAKKVFAVDVGTNQLHHQIRIHPQVVVLEKTNARFLTSEHIPDPIDFFVMDVSFISQTKMFPALIPLLSSFAQGVSLIKPQFELSSSKIGKKGIVSCSENRLYAIEQVKRSAKDIGLCFKGLVDSPIKGATGNVEYLAHWTILK
jgi:23S rRNA (cytidine1920-2'-O)/16S rRNA (cytidine1409-2'-O)-methyltransferase